MGKVQAATEALGKSTAAPDALGDQVAAMAVSVRKYQSEAADDSVVASHYGTLADGLESMARMFHQPAAVNSANPDAIKNVMGQVVGAEIWRCP